MAITAPIDPNDKDKRVETIRTPISEEQLSRLFIDVWKNLFGAIPTKEQLAIVMAQNKIETGGSGRAMFNWNIGNITHVPNDGFDYFIHQNKDGDDIKIMEQVSKGNWKPFFMKFRSYNSPEEGVRDYLNNIKNRGGGSVWKEVLNANPIAFSKALKRSGYYTANEEDTINDKTGKKVPGYTSGVVSGFNEYKNKDVYNSALHTNIEPINNPMKKNEEKNSFMQELDQLLDNYLVSLKGQ